MIRLFIADDHPIVREGLKRIIADAADMRVVGETASGEGLLAEIGNQPVDVVLLDISMPGPGVLELIRRLRAMRPKLHILVLSVQPEEVYALRAIAAGAAGYLTKDQSPAELAGAIRRVYRGNRYVSPSLAETLLPGSEAGVTRDPHAALSNREYQVLEHLGKGRSAKEIAVLLGLSPKSVSTYRARILRKVHLKTTAELVRYAVEHDLGRTT